MALETPKTNSAELVVLEALRQYRTIVEFCNNNSFDWIHKSVRKFTKTQMFVYSLIFNLLPNLMCGLRIRKPPKYVFAGLTHLGIINVLKPSDVMIFGGLSDFLPCWKMGLRYHWSGYLYKCFEMAINANKLRPLEKSIAFIQEYFSGQAAVGGYLFLQEDHRGIGLILSLSLKNIEGISVVSIAHGYDYAFNEENKMVDGRNSKFNLTYDSRQTDLLKSIFCKQSVYELGLPYDVSPARNVSRKIVLVEHTGVAAGAEYIISMYHLINIYRILVSCGFDVVYRARPRSDYSDIPRLFHNIYSGSKAELFSNELMIFIGFSSTLLYEAKVHGNIVVGLDTSELFHQRNFDVDATIFADKYEQLPKLLSDLLSIKREGQIRNIEALSVRFDRCLKSIDDYRRNHG